MNQREMFERSFQRPSDYFYLSEELRQDIDKRLGILNWSGKSLSKKDLKRYRAHYTNGRRIRI